MCKKRLDLLGKMVSNDGQPQVEEKCMKAIFERLMKGI
jgi:hypothetical protein